MAAIGQKSAVSSKCPSSARQTPNSHQGSSVGVPVRCVSKQIAPYLVQFLVAVSMAVRYQLFCFWLRRIAKYI